MIKIGDKKGDFLIKAEIGKGGMGTIYYATDTMLNRDVALKVIHPQLANNSQLLERFKIEAMTQAKMSHPNIVMIYSFSKIDNENIIAMEYIEGKNLKDLLLEKKILLIDEAIDILKQILKGLIYSHSRNVIHRDIKPANILITEDNIVKLSDFGIAKVFGKQGLTKTGMLLGTPWYTPPEQILGENIDFRSDLYSVGVTFFEMVTGTVPFDSETNSDFQIQKAHLETPPPRPSIYNPEIGSRIEKFILKALQKKPEKRFQSAADMMKSVEQLEKKVAETTMIKREKTALMSSGATPKKRKSIRTVFILLIIMLIGAGAIMSYIYLIKPSARKVIVKNEPVAVKKKEVQLSSGENKEKDIPVEIKTQDPKQKKDLNKSEELNKKQIIKRDKELNVEKRSVKKENTKAGRKKGHMAEKKNQTTANIKKKENPSENITEIQPAGKPDVNIEAELVKLGNILAKGDLKGAEAKVSVLMKQNIRAAKLYSFAGKIKFIKKDFSAAESLWAKSLKLNGSINLRFFHKHGIFNKGCSGELIIKKGLVIFDSLTKPSHSLALTIDRIRKIQKPRNSYGIIISYLSGKKTKKSVFILRGRNRRGEKFLVEFLNKYILEEK